MVQTKQQRGSMGIPPEMMENVQRTQEKKRAESEKKTAPPPPTPPPAEEAPNVEENKEMVEALDPVNVLKKLGVDFTEADLQKLLFKGFCDFHIEIVPNMLKATIKTLTVDEYDEIDEIVAQEIKDIQMTNEGFESRRSMWILAYSVTHLERIQGGKSQGLRIIAKPIAVEGEKDVIDRVETAKRRRQVLGKMSPSVINPLSRKQGALVTAVNLLAQDPESVLKKS